MKRIVIPLCLAILLAFGCTKDSEKYIAIVNDSKIPRQKFDFIIVKQMKQIEKMGRQIAPEQKYDLQKMILDKMIAIELLLQEAKKANVAIPDDEVNKKFDIIKSQYKQKEDFEKVLKENEITEADIRDDLKKNITIDTFLEKEIVGKIQIDDAEIKKFYDENKERFNVPDQVRASHILLRSKAPKGTPEADKEDKENKAKLAAIRKDVMDKKKDFAAAAGEFSEDDTKTRGGDLGFFSRDRIIPEFSKVAFSLKPGTISEPFKTNFGYHILAVTDKKAAHQKSYDEVKADIKQVLVRQKSGMRVQEYIENLKKNAKITSFLAEPAPAAAAPPPTAAPPASAPSAAPAPPAAPPAGPKQDNKATPAK